MHPDTIYRALSTLADQADARYYETVRSRTGREWWQVSRTEHDSHPEIVEAFRTKRNATDALLMFVRTGTTPISSLSLREGER